MRILHRDSEVLKLRIEQEDDLWSLARITTAGRRIGMLGERRDQTTTGEEGGRAKSAERKRMWIKLAIESSEYQTFSDNLRVHGIIEEAQFDKGSHHTHIVQTGDEVEITDGRGFPQTDFDLIDNAVKSSGNARAAIIVVESDEILLFHLTGRGIREVSQWTMRGGGKYEGGKAAAQVSDSFMTKVALELKDSLTQTALIICGPGMAREKLRQALAIDALSIATSIGGRAAANEVLAKGLAGKALDEHSIVKEVGLLEQAWERMATNGAVSYGRESLEEALAQGAIETLLVNVDSLRSEEWLQEMCSMLSEIGAKAIQCSADHDSGQQLLGMGGAVALLRFKV